jgi:hypothetical protein
MKRQSWNTYAVLLVTAAFAVAVIAATAAQAEGPPINAGQQAGIVWERAHANGAKHGGQSPNLTYHGGPVMTQPVTVTPIFWGKSWNPSVGDKISGIGQFYGGLSGSSYAQTTGEYTNSAGAHVSSGASVTGGLVDTTSAPSRAPQTSAILAEVVKEIPNPSPTGYYPVYVDTPRGNAGYCAWHSAGTAHGVTVQFAFFFNLDNDSGCNPNAPTNLGHSAGLSALANVSGHEFSEMMSDPQLNAWYDSQGSENADKCAWTFGPNLDTLGGSQWKIQGNWSNAAYTAGTGYTDPTAGFVRGCINGH